jgi:hypothetical protein
MIIFFLIILIYFQQLDILPIPAIPILIPAIPIPILIPTLALYEITDTTIPFKKQSKIRSHRSV